MCNTIILCGGTINYLTLPISTNTNNSMIPINGKPVISWIIDDLISKNIKEIIIVLKKDNEHLRKFLLRAYQKRLKLQIVSIDESFSILHSLKEGLTAADQSIPTKVILGDTLIKDKFLCDEDFIYVQEVEDCKRWCIASSDENNIVNGYYDKQEKVPLPHLALCGYYYFSNTSRLINENKLCLQRGEKQMSQVLQAYQKFHPIKIKVAQEWFDFGNIDNLIQAKQKLLQSRFFNSLSVDPVLNTITKVSDFDTKLRDELNWYKSLPKELRVLTPRIISEEEINGKLNITQEYYGYPTLAELYLFSDLSIDNWHSIIKKILTLHQTFERYVSNISEDDLFKIYFSKTIERISQLRKNNYWDNLLKKEKIVYNGKELWNIDSLEKKLEVKIKTLVTKSKICIIHGDLCFSNILYDLNNQIIRLIDPRGSFGKPGIYGDPRYDMAKLRHSIKGKYDYITSDLFEIIDTNEGFEGSIFSNNITDELASEFDHELHKFGYDVEEISFIEGLLFISMLPFHNDKPQRQKMMFVIGLERLNQSLSNSYHN